MRPEDYLTFPPAVPRPNSLSFDDRSCPTMQLTGGDGADHQVRFSDNIPILRIKFKSLLTLFVFAPKRSCIVNVAPMGRCPTRLAFPSHLPNRVHTLLSLTPAMCMVILRQIRDPYSKLRRLQHRHREPIPRRGLNAPLMPLLPTFVQHHSLP